MKSKQIIVLTIIFLLLAAGVAVKELHKLAALSSELYDSLNLSWDVGRAAKIEITQGKGEPAVEILKENGMWKLPGLWNAGADGGKIENFLSGLREMKGELRAKDKSLFGDFGIGDEEACRLVLKDQNQSVLLALLLGKKKPLSADAVFLRQPDSEAVYLANRDIFLLMGIPGNVFGAKLRNEFWADLKIVHVPAQQIAGIKTSRFDRGKEIEVLNLARDLSGSKEIWKFGREGVKEKPGQEKTKGFLQALGNWGAEKVLDPQGAGHGFEKPSWQMKISTISGEEIIVTGGSKNPENQNIFFKVSTGPAVFEVSPYLFKDIDRDEKYFFLEENPAKNPAQ